MTRTRKRLAVSAMILVVIAPLTVVAATTSLATRVTKADVASARSKLNTLNHQLEVVVEQYNGARVLLQQAQQKLATARSQMNQAQATADAARAQLGQRAAEAYTGMGSQLDTLLGTQSIADFSDRLEFMGALAQSDADLATSADAARQQAAWASRQYSDAVAAAHGQLDSVNAQRDHISGLLTQAQTLYRQTAANYQAYLAAQRAALRAQRRQDNTGTTAGTTAPTSGNSGGVGGGGYHSPPPNLTGATAAIAAAKSVLGVQYVFAAADPNVGFDCSGLTMWSWAHAGVSLPHNAAMQYDALPHVALSQIQPGDLLFFFSPISHVAMYLGGGMIIHATHPGPGGEVHIEALDPVWRPLIVGAARP